MHFKKKIVIALTEQLILSLLCQLIFVINLFKTCPDNGSGVFLNSFCEYSIGSY